MTLYRYRAIDGSGNSIEGEIDHVDQAAVIQRLCDLGYVPVHAEEAAASKPRKRGLHYQLPGRVGLSLGELSLLTRELATLVQAGLPIDRSLETVVRLTQRKAVRKTLESVLDDVRGGASFSAALAARADVFPKYYASLIKAGEIGGALDSVLPQLADFVDKSKTARDSIKSALVYPTILVIMSALAVVVLLAVVVPEFESLFRDAGAALPLATRILLRVGEMAERYGWIVGLCLGAGTAVLFHQLNKPGPRRRWDALILGTPMAGELVRKAEAARFGRTVGTLLRNGVTLLHALRIVRDTHGNRVVQDAIERVASELKQGKGLAGPLQAENVFPPLVIQLIRVGEESGRIDELLIRVADIFERDVQRTAERFIAILVPALTIGLGVLIAAIIASVLVAILSINSLAF